MTSKTDWYNFTENLKKIINFSDLYYKGIKVTEIKDNKIICNKLILKYPEVFKNGLHKSLEDVIKSFKMECEGNCLKKLLENL